MQKLDNLQGLRAVAFIMIFLSHCGIGELAGLAVTIFFVLSGFLMVYNYFFRDTVDCSIKQNILFSYKKINKLFPLHLIMMLPVLALTLYSAIKDDSFNMGFVLKQGAVLLSNILLIQSWIPIRDVYFGYNGVAWFLSVCTFLYFVFPFILKKMKSKWSCKKAIFAVIGCFAVQCIFSVFVSVVNCEWITVHRVYLVYIFPLYRIFDFVIGCNLGYLFLHTDCKNKSAKANFTILELLSFLIAFGIPVLVDLVGLGEVFWSAKDIPGVIILIFVLGFNKGIVSQLLSTKAFVALGNISAYTFLIHQVVINLLQLFLGNKYIVALVAFAVTIVIAFVCGWFSKLRHTRRV